MGQVQGIVRRGGMKLHLACGTRHIRGFVHIDIAPPGACRPRARSVDRLDFIADGGASLVYASHVLEHFSRKDVPRALREWHRVLRPGGVLRLAVPAFAAVVAVHHRDGFVDGCTGVIGLVCGGQRDQWDFHKIILDRPFLTRLLREAGFGEVRGSDWRRTEHTDVDDFSQAYLPHLDKRNGTLMSLSLEAVK